MSTFKPQPLPWNVDLMSGFLSANSINRHYELYVQHVESLSRYVEKYPKLKKLALSEIAREYLSDIKHDACEILNHEFFFAGLTPNPTEPSGRIYQMIMDQYSSFENFQLEFQKKADHLFGSGWIWLVYDPSSNFLLIVPGGDSYNPVMDKYVPILALDLWEHSYYPDYNSDRERYLENFWNYLNWNRIEEITAEYVFGYNIS